MKTTMRNCCGYGALIFLTLSCLTVESSRPPAFTSTELPLEDVHFSDGVNYEAGGNGNGNGTTGHHGKRWAVLVAGSSGYENYRHQADVCHAYQVLKKGGLKDENIIVFMYDDIAFHKSNPRPGVIINKPIGDNVYVGVPKDYTGDNVNVHNFYAVILGNKSALTGGSGKVVDSGPNDHIFIYYADHGSSGVLGMPKGGYVYAKDLINVLKKKHEAKAYKKMVIYVEACESGSMFEGLLPNNINIYATTAANTKESSWSIYCPGEDPAHLRGYDTCLGDVYSISWLEDSEKHDLRKETLGQQYEVVRRRTSGESFYYGSHVMQFGNKKCGNDSVSSYIGTNPANDNFTIVQYPSPPSPTRLTQRDADLRHFWHKYHKAPNGSNDKLEAKKRLLAELSYRKHVDNSINHIKMILFGKSNISSVALETVRPTGQPLVDDWDCFKTLVATYEKHCGSLSTYGMKYMRAIANMCNVGVTKEQMAAASMQTCTKKPPT